MKVSLARRRCVASHVLEAAADWISQRSIEPRFQANRDLTLATLPVCRGTCVTTVPV